MDTTIKTCTTLENIPDIQKELLERNKITNLDIALAYNEIKRKREEDNKSWIRKLFDKLFNKRCKYEKFQEQLISFYNAGLLTDELLAKITGNDYDPTEEECKRMFENVITLTSIPQFERSERQ